MSSYTQRRKAQIHNLLGGKCRHCGEKDPRVLQIDHVYADGAKERREGVSRMQLYHNIERETKRYQLLCANCNWKKREKDFKIQNKLKNRKGHLTNLVLAVVVGVILAFFVGRFIRMVIGG